MDTYVALLRGVNVGGKNKLAMKELALHLEKAGFKNVTNYIQSGNLVLSSTHHPLKKIQQLIKIKFSLQPDISVLSKQQFLSAVDSNPFQARESRCVHLYFCVETPKLNLSKLDQLRSETEHYKLIDNVFYLHAPDGVGRSKLIANIETCLGVSATGRNLNTINKLNDILLNTV